MSGGEIAALIAALAFVGLVAFLSLTLVRVQGVLLSAQSLVQDVNRQTVPLLEELRQTVTTLNVELERLDTILGSVESVSSSVSNVTGLVTSAATNPIVKGLSLLAGARAAVKSLRKRGQRE